MYIGAAHRAARRPQFAGRSSQLAGRRPHVGARAWRARPGICAIPRSFRWGNHTNSQRVAHVAPSTSYEPRATSHEPRATSHEPRATSHEPLKKALSSQTTLFLSSLNITLDFTGTKATSANINSFYFAVDDSADTLDIRFPGFFRFQVGMADIHAAHCSFTTDFAKVCHWLHLPAPSQYNI